jgi:hypothetical protein
MNRYSVRGVTPRRRAVSAVFSQVMSDDELMTIETLPHVCVVVVFLSVAILRTKWREIHPSAVLTRFRSPRDRHEVRESMKSVEIHRNLP